MTNYGGSEDPLFVFQIDMRAETDYYIIMIDFDLKALVVREDSTELFKKMLSDGTLRQVFPAFADLDMGTKGHKDVFLHSLKVLENARELSDHKNDVVLLTAALVHDIGKRATRKFTKKGATFVNHDVVGAKIARKILPDLGYNKTEVKEISTLVKLHMRGHSFERGWTDSAIRRLARDAGSDKQVRRLVIIFASDSTSKSSKKRAHYRKNAENLLSAIERVKNDDEKAARRPVLNGNEVAKFLNIAPGPELGKYMKLLQTEENLNISRDEAFELIKNAAEG